MTITEYECKECGGRIIGITLLSSPPIHQLKCEKCGRIASSYREEIRKEVI